MHDNDHKVGDYDDDNNDNNDNGNVGDDDIPAIAPHPPPLVEFDKG